MKARAACTAKWGGRVVVASSPPLVLRDEGKGEGMVVVVVTQCHRRPRFGSTGRWWWHGVVVVSVARVVPSCRRRCRHGGAVVVVARHCRCRCRVIATVGVARRG